MKKNKEINLRSWLVPRLRRLSYTWPNRNEAKKLARVERGKYKCNICKEIFGAKEIYMDHINPVVSVEAGFENIGKYVESLFCSIENYQALCEVCHTKKTESENEQRKINKKLDSK